MGEEKIRINFWVDESLYYAIKEKLLDHKRSTRERITITDICTKALQKFITPKEGNEMNITEEIRKAFIQRVADVAKTIGVDDVVFFVWDTEDETIREIWGDRGTVGFTNPAFKPICNLNYHDCQGPKTKAERLEFAKEFVANVEFANDFAEWELHKYDGCY